MPNVELSEYMVTAKYWATKYFDFEIHVYPIRDWQGHKLNSDTCKCRPTVKHVALSTMYVHHSYDGRELSENNGE